MKKMKLVLGIALFALTGAAFAQDAASGIVTSTDPARAAAVEQHAEALRSQQQGGSEAPPAQHPMMKHHMSGHAMMMKGHASKHRGHQGHQAHRHGKKHGAEQKG